MENWASFLLEKKSLTVYKWFQFCHNYFFHYFGNDKIFVKLMRYLVNLGTIENKGEESSLKEEKKLNAI